jgi:hypothetical protein
MVIIRGEEIRVIREYDLFDNNLMDHIGIFLKSDFNGKHLIYFPHLGEWAELEEHIFQRLSASHVSEKAAEFVNRVVQLGDPRDEE